MTETAETVAVPLRNFDTILDQEGVASITRPRAIVPPPVRERVTVTPVAHTGRAFLAKPVEAWSWSDLRDYVVTQIEERFGPFPRDSKKEYGIFRRFAETWGDKAGRIAKYAFEVEGGCWLGAPISISRFTRNCDPYFAEVIVPRLAAAPVRDW